jgi:hypothetical protein
MQIMSRAFDITETMERIARAGGLIGVEGSELARQMAMQTNLLFQEQEFYLLNGVLNETDNGTVGRQMKGLIAWILSANTVDFAAAEITAANIKTQINRTITKIVNSKGGVRPNAMYCGPVFADLLATITDPGITVTVPLDQYKNEAPTGVVGRNVGWFKSNYGILEIVMTPHLTVAANTGAAATSNVLFVHEPSLTIVDFKNGGIEVAERARSDAYIRKVVSEEITLQVQNVRAHGLLKNFWIAQA